MRSAPKFTSLHRPSTAIKGKRPRELYVDTTKNSGSDDKFDINPTSSNVLRHKKVRTGVPERDSQSTASRTGYYDKSSLDVSSPSSSTPHTPSVDVHPNTTFCQSPTTVSSDDTLQQPASTNLQVPTSPSIRTRSPQNQSESFLSVHWSVVLTSSRFPMEYARPITCIAVTDFL